MLDTNQFNAITHEGLAEKYRQLESRYTALFKLNQLSIDCADLDSFFVEVHQVIASLMNANNFYIVLYEEAQQSIEFVYHVDENDTFATGPIPLHDFAGSMTHYVIETQQPLLATPELTDLLIETKKIRPVGVAGTDWLGVPLMNNEQVVGVMAVQSYSESMRYQPEDANLLTFAAQHIVTAMMRLQDRERLQQAVDSRTKELTLQIREREKAELLQESLFKISELTNDTSIKIDKFYAMIHNIVGQLIYAKNFYIAKYNEEEQTLSFVYFHDENTKNKGFDFKPRKMGKRLTELVIREGATTLLKPEDMVELHNQGKVIKQVHNITSWLGVPLQQSGTILGAMVIQSYQDNIVYTEQDAELLNFVSQHVSTALKRKELFDFERQSHELLEQQVQLRTMALEDEIKQRKQAEEKLTHTASHDALTGLVNRSVFLDLLNHAIKCHHQNPSHLFAVLFLDLDRFKVVNDSLGHHAGDQLLKIVSVELKKLVRHHDTVARFGGDEFVILVENLDSEQEAFEISHRITTFLSSPFTIENQQVFIGTSIGVLFNDKRYNNADIMLRDADTAMYQAKDKGKGRFEVFDASMHNKVQNALTLEADIREAIALKEFVPHFQPIMRLHDNKVVGFEALARWKSVKRGFVYPDQFIPVAEETNLITQLDFLILEKACMQLKQWEEANSKSMLYVSCNLHSSHFVNVALAEEINNILKRVGLKPEQLRVELTEGALLKNSDVVLNTMQSLKQLGVKILLDDFGTGYSSLSYLHRFPIDILKIDKSFINNVHEHFNHQAIIKTIIDLATNLQMATVGEGIELPEDADLLLKMDCNYGQGYYFAKPMPSDEATAFLQQSSQLTLH